MINRITYRVSLALILFNWVCISFLMAQTAEQNTKERKVLFVKTKPIDTTQSSRLSTVSNPIVLGTKPINDSTANARRNVKPAFVRQK